MPNKYKKFQGLIPQISSPVVRASSVGPNSPSVAKSPTPPTFIEGGSSQLAATPSGKRKRDDTKGKEIDSSKAASIGGPGKKKVTIVETAATLDLPSEPHEEPEYDLIAYSDPEVIKSMRDFAVAEKALKDFHMHYDKLFKMGANIGGSQLDLLNLVNNYKTLASERGKKVRDAEAAKKQAEEKEKHSSIERQKLEDRVKALEVELEAANKAKDEAESSFFKTGGHLAGVQIFKDMDPEVYKNSWKDYASKFFRFWRVSPDYEREDNGLEEEYPPSDTEVPVEEAPADKEANQEVEEGSDKTMANLEGNTGIEDDAHT